MTARQYQAHARPLAASGALVALGGVNKVSDLNLSPLWLNPNHTAATARYVMTGHKARAIGVLDGDEILGIVSFENLAGHADEVLLGKLCSPIRISVNPSSTLREAAIVLAKENLELLPVVEGGRFAGIVTATMLLREMSRTWDPLTELPWSDRLREWGVDRLETGDELTILFVDLDDFGQYNKSHGHIVGDRVLQLVSQHLKEITDPKRDVVVRYGGDEFAIGTIRHRRDAEDLMELIYSKMDGAFVAGSEKPVEISIGLFGGRRTTERENVHYSATLDSLINLASRDCLARKAQKKRDRSAGAPPAITREDLLQGNAAPENSEPRIDPVASIDEARSLTRPRMVEVLVDEASDRGVTMATFEVDGQLWRGVSARSAADSAIESVALATLSALEKWDRTATYDYEDVAVSGQGETWVVEFAGIRRQGENRDKIAATIHRQGEKMILVGEAVIAAALG